MADPVAWGLTPSASLGTRAVTIVQALLENAPFFVLLVRSVGQLRLIGRIHATATGLSLYERDTHHAFSRLTVRVAIGLVMPVYLWTVLAFVNQGSFGAMSSFDTGIVVFVLVVSSVVFVLPLNGMHLRLVSEKSRLLQEVDRRVDAASQQLHRRLDARAFGKVAGFRDALSALMIEKDNLRRISTWPWEAETMRGFLSSIGVPVILWFITMYLGRIFR